MQFPQTKHQQWEYHQITVTLENSTQVLDDLGQDGWEAYAVFADRPTSQAPGVDYKVVVMLKRKA